LIERIHSEILNRQKCADMGAMLLAGATWCADISEVSLAGSTFLERLSTVKGRSLRYPSDVVGGCGLRGMTKRGVLVGAVELSSVCFDHLAS
jgi:hypothetical protein